MIYFHWHSGSFLAAQYDEMPGDAVFETSGRPARVREEITRSHSRSDPITGRAHGRARARYHFSEAEYWTSFCFKKLSLGFDRFPSPQKIWPSQSLSVCISFQLEFQKFCSYCSGVSLGHSFALFWNRLLQEKKRLYTTTSFTTTRDCCRCTEITVRATNEQWLQVLLIQKARLIGGRHSVSSLA